MSIEVRDHRRLPRAAPLRRLLKPVALLAVLVFVVIFLADNWSQVVAGLRDLSWGSVAAAAVAVLVGLACQMMAWRAALAGFGSTLPVHAAARIFFLGQLGKYVPGGVWPIVAQAQMSREYGVPRTSAGLAALTQMLISVVVGVAVAGVALSAAFPAALASYWWLALVAVGGAVALVPPVLNRLVGLALRAMRRSGTGRVTGRGIASSAAWSLAMWVAFGAHLWVLAAGSLPPPPDLFFLSVGAYSVAWVVGFVIVVLPAGAGAREAALVLILAPVLSRQDAIVLALVSRVVMLAGDFICAGGAVVAAQRVRRRRGPLPALPVDQPLP